MDITAWLSVSVEAEADRAEALSEALLETGALSVSIEDADAGTAAETPQFAEPGQAPARLWTHCRVIALFELIDRPLLAARIAEAAATAGMAGTPPPFSVEEVAEQDWVRTAQGQFDPIRITDRLWIVPSWHKAPEPGAINIELDPGMAFGTGSHPTTRLCLEWLCE
ncbi:MAG: 50S ribosomal protein L11 methyltransferase, partial [Betaproteobacteria bacterium]|nr:50S ribosomal protein L11 methyltransferase [Betaproteobacteria bacterium]